MDKHQVSVKVFGRVQGVCFRWFVQEKAQERNITGWVKNCYDGTVEALLQGKKDLIDDMINELKKGPPMAYVEKVAVEWDEPNQKMPFFQIRY